jgi:hypothetical protein
MGGYRPRVIAPPTRHECDQPRNMGMMRMGKSRLFPNGATVPKPVEHGTLWECPDCATWWVARPNPMHGRGLYFGSGGLVWKQVYWFNWGLRARIRKQSEEP